MKNLLIVSVLITLSFFIALTAKATVNYVSVIGGFFLIPLFGVLVSSIAITKFKKFNLLARFLIFYFPAIVYNMLDFIISPNSIDIYRLLILLLGNLSGELFFGKNPTKITAIFLVGFSAMSSFYIPQKLWRFEKILLIDEPIPRFCLKSIKGNYFTNENLKSNFALFDFYSNSCGNCFQEMPLLDEIFQEIPEVKVYAVNIGTDSIHRVIELVEGKNLNINIPFPVLYDSASLLTKKLKIQGVPQTILIDKNGNIRVWKKGRIHTKFEKDIFIGMFHK